MTVLFIIKFGSDRIKTVGVAFWNPQPCMVLYVLTKFQSALKYLIFWLIAKTFYTFSPHDYLIYRKVWLRLDKNCRRSNVLKFLLP